MNDTIYTDIGLENGVERMNIDYNGMKLRVRFDKGATLCDYCEEHSHYEETDGRLPVDTAEGEAQLILHKSHLCEHIYATIQYDDGGGTGDYFVTVDGSEPPHCVSPYDDDEYLAEQLKQSEEEPYDTEQPSLALPDGDEQ